MYQVFMRFKIEPILFIASIILIYPHAGYKYLTFIRSSLIVFHFVYDLLSRSNLVYACVRSIPTEN